MKKMLASYFFYVYKCAHKTLVPSSSGLGHRPLTAVTRVRVSLGSPIKQYPLYEGIVLLIIVSWNLNARGASLTTSERHTGCAGSRCIANERSCNSSHLWRRVVELEMLIKLDYTISASFVVSLG